MNKNDEIEINVFSEMLFLEKCSLDDVSLMIRLDTKRARGYKTFFMLNSAEHKIYPAHKC